MTILLVVVRALGVTVICVVKVDTGTVAKMDDFLLASIVAYDRAITLSERVKGRAPTVASVMLYKYLFLVCHSGLSGIFPKDSRPACRQAGTRSLSRLVQGLPE